LLLNVENKRVEIVVSEQLYGSKGFGSLISKLAFEIETGYLRVEITPLTSGITLGSKK